MKVYINSKSLADVVAGRATALIASGKAGVIANEVPLYSLEEMQEISLNRIANALDKLVEMHGASMPQDQKGKRK